MNNPTAAAANGLLRVRVSHREVQAEDVVALTLVPTDEAPDALPAFDAGAHIDLHLPNGLVRQYSLCNAPHERGRYLVAVLREPAGRGGSACVHEALHVGTTLPISRPRNAFALAPCPHTLLLAGGIGITPFMAYLAELEAQGASFELHYAYRSGLTDAYAAELRERLGERFHGYDAAAGQRLDCTSLFAGKPLGSHLYVCGPQRLLDELRTLAGAHGWSAGRLHWEAFAAPEPGQPFTVELARSGQRLQVPGDHSLLEALEAAGVEVPNLCRGGVCGQCTTRYLSGEVEHRDHYLDEQQRGAALMPCVSRGGCSGTLLLDL